MCCRRQVLLVFGALKLHVCVRVGLGVLVGWLVYLARWLVAGANWGGPHDPSFTRSALTHHPVRGGCRVCLPIAVR